MSSIVESQVSGSKSWISTNSSWMILESSFWGSGITLWPRYSPAGTMNGSDVVVAGGADACWSAIAAVCGCCAVVLW